MAFKMDSLFHEYWALRGFMGDVNRATNATNNTRPKKQVKTVVQAKEVLTKDGRIVTLRTVTQTTTDNVY